METKKNVASFINQKVKPFQPRGKYGRRDIGKRPLLLKPGRTANYSELNELFQSYSSPNRPIAKFNDPVNATDVGLRICFSNLTKTGIHSVSVTYVISAEPDADKATYRITNFYGICGGEILTIGDEPNDNSFELVKGPYYGCPA